MLFESLTQNCILSLPRVSLFVYEFYFGNRVVPFAMFETLYKTLYKGVVHKLRNRGKHVILDIDKFDSCSTEEGSSSAF